MSPSLTRGIALAMLVLAARPASAGKQCDAPAEAWQPRSAVHTLAERNGWRVDRLKIDDGCYEIKARDADGRRLKARIDPASLEVLSVKREHGERDRLRERQRGAPPPPAPNASGANG